MIEFQFVRIFIGNAQDLLRRDSTGWFDLLKEYHLPGRQEWTYDKYFRQEGLAWILHGRASLHLPQGWNSNDFDQERELKLTKSSIVLENVLAFLDNYFQSNDIDCPGVQVDIRYIRLPWCAIYDKYVQYCKKLRLKPTRYDKFTAIRKEYRENN